MSPKEFFVDKIAAWFARNGVNALLYDARHLGVSDGQPRCDLDPQKMSEDNSDAVTVCIYQCLRLLLPYSPIY